MEALPQKNDACIEIPLSSMSITGFCATALRVRVKNGIVRVVPLMQGSYDINGLGTLPDAAPPARDPSPDDENATLPLGGGNTTLGPFDAPFNCKDANASGLFYRRPPLD
jgi:hypothetical protein